MAWLLRSLVLGVAFALAAGVVELAFQALPTLQRGFGPGPVFLLQTALIELLLGAILGIVGAPLLRWRVPRIPEAWVHLAWMTAAWLGLGLAVEFEAPMGRPMALIPPLAAGILVLAGRALGRSRPVLPWALGSMALVFASAAPTAYIVTTSTVPAPPAELPPAPEGAPDIVLVVLDTVRAQSVSAYGYDRETAPHFLALASEGALFSDATSPSTWSLPSHASLFTGRYPSSHGAHGESLSLDGRFPTLAQVLQSVGYETRCFTANAWISDGLGLTRGFGWQDESWRSEAGAGRNFAFAHRLLDRLGIAGGDKGGATVARHFGDWMRARPVDARPTFVFLNFIEAHFPYHQLPEEYVSKFTDRPRAELEEISMALMAQQFGGPGRDPAEAGPAAVDMYDGGIVYSDELLHRIVSAIRDRGTLNDTVLVVLADHGELLGERARFFGHGPSLYQPMVRVPFMIRYPPRIPGGTRVDAPVSTLGAFGTVLDLAGIEPPPTLHVGSLMPLVEGGSDRPGPVLSEVMRPIQLGGGDQARPDPQMDGRDRLRGYRDGSWKLVETSRGAAFLYDLSVDPGENRNLASSHPEQLARMRAELESTRQQLGLPALDAEFALGDAAPAMDEATRERLKQLGYVE